MEALQREGWIDGFALTSYEPERERYGGADRCLLSERYFAADSAFARKTFDYFVAEGMGAEETLFAMAFSVLEIAVDFGLTVEAVIRLLRRDKSGSRGARSPVVAQASGALLRRFQNEIDCMAASRRAPLGLLRHLTKVCDARSDETQSARQALLDALCDDDHGREQLFRSHAHMSINRLTCSGMRDAEPIAYALAVRIAQNLVARGSLPNPRIDILRKSVDPRAAQSAA
jgi:thiopeptide-type bacteriocin biosynthesis protein